MIIIDKNSKVIDLVRESVNSGEEVEYEIIHAVDNPDENGTLDRDKVQFDVIIKVVYPESIIDHILKISQKTPVVLEALAKSKGVNLEFSIPSGIIINVEDILIERVLENLGTNAIKFTPKGGTVEVYVKSDNSYIYIHIKDSGTGMNDKTKHKILTGQSTTSEGTSGEKGIGLGMDFVRNAIKVHNGQLVINTAPNLGTEFVISIPFKDVDKEVA